MSNPDTLPRNLIYLITSGRTTVHTTPATEAFLDILNLVRAGVAAHLDFIQIREKNLSASILFELAAAAARITNGSATKLLINDRSDIAAAAGADGVHLTTQSLPTEVVRHTFGDEFLIGVSTHSELEAEDARRSGADFVVFGPVFETPSKQIYGEPQGLEKLHEVTSALHDFPVLAIGGIDLDNAADCFRAGASGIAAIRLFIDTDLKWTLSKLNQLY